MKFSFPFLNKNCGDYEFTDIFLTLINSKNFRKKKDKSFLLFGVAEVEPGVGCECDSEIFHCSKTFLLPRMSIPGIFPLFSCFKSSKI